VAERRTFDRPVLLGAAWLGLIVLLAYGFDLGHGFIKDDYAWIATSRIEGPGDLRRIFADTPMGFYRPLVALSFSVNHLLFGLAPWPYAATNLLLAGAIAVALACLVRRFGLPWGAALFAAGIWILNFHGINMSILWISGRTSLLGTLFAVLAALAFQGGRRYLAGLMVLLSLLSKEEPLLLPLVLAMWLAIDLRHTGEGGWPAAVARAAAATWPSFAAAGIYLALRATTQAFTPATAPAFYQLDVAGIGANTVQYLDRSLTFTAIVLLLGALICSARRLTLTPAERAIALKGAIWLVGGFGLTILLPVRSSLYVCLPSIGSAMIAAAAGTAEWRAMRSPRLGVAALVLLPLLLLPVYRARNLRMTREAELAAHTLTTIGEQIDRPGVTRIILHDAPGSRPSLADAFANALPVAAALFYPGPERPKVILAGDRVASFPDAHTVAFTLRNGRLHKRQ
jgi:hypothetical protein